MAAVNRLPYTIIVLIIFSDRLGSLNLFLVILKIEFRLWWWWGGGGGGGAGLASHIFITYHAQTHSIKRSLLFSFLLKQEGKDGPNPLT